MTKCDFCEKSMIKDGVLTCANNGPSSLYCDDALERFTKAVKESNKKVNK